ncbi:excinuclease ABC subunit UvrA [Selenomonadales bacterium OttesenSCG-928-I06]|nr:excinuclease ABC subunit UvrA [Selenomonadales bacterium OttesenSCG-928-I06]
MKENRNYLENIVIKGAREHNLKNINLTIPRNKLVVITGLSGSGKSSLAFDTIYAEGQRRYVESLSAYARQFLGQMDKPDVDYIEGLSPAISIDQKTTSRNPRSTVGTVTEIYDYLRLLFARVGKPFCPKCGKPISQQTIEQMVDNIGDLGLDTRLMILAPLVRGKKGIHQKVFEDIRKNGYVRVRVDGDIRDVSEYLDGQITLEKNKKHTIEVVVDRIVIKENYTTRLADSLETALKLGSGLVSVITVPRDDSATKSQELLFSQNFACPDCTISLPELAPRMFSFNNPYGACPDCTGLGNNLEFDPYLIIPDPDKSFSDGVITPFSKNIKSYFMCQLEAVLDHYGFTLDTVFSTLPEKVRNIVLYGAKEGKTFSFYYENMMGEVRKHTRPFEGVLPLINRRYKEAFTDKAREDMEKYMTFRVCPTCKGARLNEAALSVKIGDKNINEVTRFTVAECIKFFSNLDFTEREKKIAAQVLKEINERLGFLLNVGLDYLTLARSAGTLSGGEAQRIRLATQIGSGLVGVLYILDEPSIGLHQRDNYKLLNTLKGMRDLGNTLLVVEHDEDTMYAADEIIDIGPGAGAHGGTIIAQGNIESIKNCPESVTGNYLSGKKFIPVPIKRRPPNGKWIDIKKASENNLNNLNIKFPLGVFTVVTGVSGSGKSTLVNEVLSKGVKNLINRNKTHYKNYEEILGIEHIDKIIEVDQSPIGRTPRSNPATYTGVFDHIRELFSITPESKMRGYKPGRFSFNVKGGRCEACKGDGIIKIEMHFLPDVYVPCEVCKGARYNRETLEVRYKGKSIAQILDMIVSEAVVFFKNVPKISRKLETLEEVGLGYIKLGQPATTLSGGEAQRVKLATELSKRSTGKTLYILDEPTTGLHTADIHKLLQVLDQLVEGGDTVIVIEHNLDVIKCADYVIDLGPEGGDKGGKVIAAGTPEDVAETKKSYTGQFLKPILERKH